MTMDDHPTGPPRHPDDQGRSGNMLGYLPRRSFGMKLLLVCLLALLMAIPAMFVFTVLYDRSSRAENAIREISQRYGGVQASMGPVLVLPYSDRSQLDDGTPVTVRKEFVLYAETGTVKAELATELKRSGIHEVPIYSAEIDYQATFDPSRIEGALPATGKPDWDNARIYLSMSDSRAARAPTGISVNGEDLVPEPVALICFQDCSYNTSQRSLLAANIPDLTSRSGPLTVNARMVFSGGERIALAPFARNTDITVVSDWDDPKFEGGYQRNSYTPNEEGGFTATWSIPYEARGIPGMGSGLSISDTVQTGNTISIQFVQNATPYQSVQRALKYALMFIGFVFLAYFLFEITSHQRAHPAQYVLVGLAQSVFYLLLLSMSEQFGFDLAFIIAAAMTVTLTAGYAVSVFKDRKYGLRALGVFTGIYGLIYVLMRLQDYALLVGALASFVAIGFTMYMTRNIDWYGQQSETD